MRTDQRAPSLRLIDYYLVEGANAFAVTLFLLSIFFWAQARFGYSHIENLALGAVQGIAHMLASQIGGRLGDRAGYNRILVTGISGALLTSASGWLPEARWMPMVVSCLYAVFIATTWPVLEAGCMHIPGKLNVPQRLGIYNLVWSFAGAAGFLLSGFVFQWNIHSIFWIPAGIHALQLGWIYHQRGRHRIDGETAMHFAHAGHAVPVEEKRRLARLSWLSNGFAYFLGSGFAALTPHLGERLGLNQAWTMWLGASLLVSRATGFLVLAQWKGWHYHRGWGLYALWSAPVWLAVVFFSGHVVLVLAGCMLLGFSFGLSYYMSIYYSLDASDQKGEQGAWHESIIGLGMLTGPLVGAAGGYVTGSTAGAKATILGAALCISVAGFALANRTFRPD